MPIVPEDVLLDVLRRCLDLSRDVLAHLAARGSRSVPAEVLERYTALVDDVARQKRRDSVLSDESWEWIWETGKELNHLQLYGRLAWINYNLFDLL